MKNIVKKVLSFMMVLMLVVMAVPVSEVKAYSKVKLTVNGATENDTFQLYKVIDINFDEEHNNVTYEWVDESIKTAVGNKTVEDFEKIGSVDDRQSALAGIPAILKDEWEYKDTVSANEEGVATWSDVEVGGYLVVPTSTTDVYQMMLVVVQPKNVGGTYVVENTAITTKKEDLSITKQATTGDTTGAIQTVKYEIVTKMPVYDDGATEKTFIIGDTLATGLTLDTNSLVVSGSENGTSYKTIGDYTGPNNEHLGAYTVGTTINLSGAEENVVSKHTSPTFVIDFSYDTVDTSYNYIKIEYNVTLSDTATAGLYDNDVVLKYSNYPFTSENYEYATADETVKTYKITIKKDNATGTLLTGAEFSLYKKLSDSTEMSDEEIVTALNGLEIYEEKAVVLGGPDNTVPQLPEGSYILVDTFTPTGIGGYYSIDKIDAGDYQIVETKAPTGYTLPNASYSVSVNDDTDDDDGIIDNIITKEIENNSGFTLPETGGTGTVIFTVVGVSLMCVAVLAFFILRKKEMNKN